MDCGHKAGFIWKVQNQGNQYKMDKSERKKLLRLYDGLTMYALSHSFISPDKERLEDMNKIREIIQDG